MSTTKITASKLTRLLVRVRFDATIWKGKVISVNGHPPIHNIRLIEADTRGELIENIVTEWWSKFPSDGEFQALEVLQPDTTFRITLRKSSK